MGSYRFKQVDVFTARPFYGNPVAVILDADDIDPSEMQRIARWTNLSETTFVLRATAPEASYRLRIFTPTMELPFAGHPTIGSVHAVTEHLPGLRGARTLIQECAAGLLPLTIEGDGPERRISVLVPEPKVTQMGSAVAEELSAALGACISKAAEPLAVDVGPVWLIAFFDDVETVQRLEPDMAAVAKLSRELRVAGVTVFSIEAAGDAQPFEGLRTTLHVRSFAPAHEIPEDPVCGSGNASVGAFLAHTGLLKRTGTAYVASQGTELGRDGRVAVTVGEEGRRVTIGGMAVTVIEGTIRT